MPGGAAAKSSAGGGVQVGDLLEAVDGVDVRAWPLKKLANEMVCGCICVLVCLLPESPSPFPRVVFVAQRSPSSQRKEATRRT